MQAACCQLWGVWKAKSPILSYHQLQSAQCKIMNRGNLSGNQGSPLLIRTSAQPYSANYWTAEKVDGHYFGPTQKIDPKLGHLKSLTRNFSTFSYCRLFHCGHFPTDDFFNVDFFKLRQIFWILHFDLFTSDLKSLQSVQGNNCHIGCKNMTSFTYAETRFDAWTSRTCVF